MEPAPADRSNTVRVLIADSNQMHCELLVGALRRRPEFDVHACKMDVEAVVTTAKSSSMDVAVLCAQSSQECWKDLTIVRRLHVAQPTLAKVLLLDTYDPSLVVNAFRSGVKGLFCLSEHPFRLLCKCIQCVSQGQVWANSEQLQLLITALSSVPSLRTVNALGKKLLTRREEQVVALVADGLSNREVAEELALSEHTIKKYLFLIFDKLGISSRVELVLYAMSHGEHRDAEWVAGSGA